MNNNPIATVGKTLKRHERKILITITVVSTTAAVLMRTGIAQHNAFLKEQGLYDQFYAMTE
mgnify:CR=1 FL=1